MRNKSSLIHWSSCEFRAVPCWKVFLIFGTGRLPSLFWYLLSIDHALLFQLASLLIAVIAVSSWWNRLCLYWELPKAYIQMDRNCSECSEPIENLNLIKCYLCERAAHMKSFGWARSNLDFVNGQANLLWFCANCIKSVELFKVTRIASQWKCNHFFCCWSYQWSMARTN